MSKAFSSDEIDAHELALSYAKYTDRNLFITGKAGTGKTTLLHKINEIKEKSKAITAPTGVAAINAGGATLHSFFQLPFGSFIPDNDFHIPPQSESGLNNPYTLTKGLRMSASKIKVLRKLELLIIDEISMVRSDTLDMIDHILKHYRKQYDRPFGGVQVIFFGDLHQLPPVIREQEKNILAPYYASEFFFDSQVVQTCELLTIELEKVYRQKDETFVKILNEVRNNALSTESLNFLHQRYQPEVNLDKLDHHYITLTTHNRLADTINREELNKLTTKPYTFTAEIEGTFYDNAYPTEQKLELKPGAQVMFIKNDTESGAYFNGKIGTVHNVDKEKVTVKCPDDIEEIEVEKVSWDNVQYTFDKEENQIYENVLGSFKQFPLRLAWAITIHKSQGLTFDRAVLDVGQAFAPGQVYVALSRLRSLEGLILRSKIQNNRIFSFPEVVRFSQEKSDLQKLKSQLEGEQRKYAFRLLKEAFDFREISENQLELLNFTTSKSIPDKEEVMQKVKTVLPIATKMMHDAESFRSGEMTRLLSLPNGQGYQQLSKRTNDAYKYFTEQINTNLIALTDSIIDQLKTKSKVKEYLSHVHELYVRLEFKKAQLGKAVRLAKGLASGENMSGIMNQLSKTDDQPKIQTLTEKGIKKGQPPKGQTRIETLKLYQDGKDPQEIADIRGLKVSTIMTHLTDFIASGEVDIFDLVDGADIERIMQAFDQQKDDGGLKDLYATLNGEYEYDTLRMVGKYRLAIKEEN